MAKKALKDKDYEKLGRLLVSIGEIGFKDKKALYRTEFIKGIFRGFGGIIGATIVVAVLVILLNMLGELPFIGTIADSARESIKTTSE
jgi:hypothetical protein